MQSIIGIIPEYPEHSRHNIYGRIRMPPVGIVSVLSQLAHDPRYSVYAIDENNYRGPCDFTGMANHDFLQGKEPVDIAMFYGGMSNSVPRLFSVAKQYQSRGVTTIAGGSHVDALPEEALMSGVDIVVHGEGEIVVQEVLDTLGGRPVSGAREDLETIPGISFLDDAGNHVFTERRAPITDLDALADPDLTLIKYLDRRWSAIPINRGRGCNWNCEFCVVNTQYGRFKSNSVAKAVKQVTKYADMGYKRFFFTDDNFAQHPRETIELCNQLAAYQKEFGKKLSLTIQVRSEVAENDELIAAMRAAGVMTMAIGYESPIDEELAGMNKGVTVDKLTERSRKLSHHFYLHGMFIFGYPTFGEPSTLSLEERARAYKRFFKKARIDTVQVLNAVPLPGSLLREKLDQEGRLFPKEMIGWDKYDGAFLCYDSRPDGYDPYELHSWPRVLMAKRYLGNFVRRNLNYGNWLDWTYNATIGFPIQFGAFYTKRFFRNINERRREKNLETGGFFRAPLVETWRDVKRQWRNLFVRTYAAGIVRRWRTAYEKSDYVDRLKELLKKPSGESLSGK